MLFIAIDWFVCSVTLQTTFGFLFYFDWKLQCHCCWRRCCIYVGKSQLFTCKLRSKRGKCMRSYMNAVNIDIRRQYIIQCCCRFASFSLYFSSTISTLYALIPHCFYFIFHFRLMVETTKNCMVRKIENRTQALMPMCFVNGIQFHALHLATLYVFI